MKAIKLLTALSLGLVVVPAMAGTLTCTSHKSFTSCGLSNADRRDIGIKTVKSGSCVLGTSWGVDTSAIWVDKGCSAVFQYSGVDDYAYTDNVTIVFRPGWRYIPWYYDYDDDHYYYSYQYYHRHPHYHYNYHKAQHHHNKYHHDHVTTQGSSTKHHSTTSVTKSTDKGTTTVKKRTVNQ